ncbi:uncharacterized protein EDB91DRAFT_810434 [Suillus paluster]|uniref:uncharacterized protein n=1 Tax=Suillus paluster TaxID=48578 RepID=UPI001B863EB0|nr:uncharacterized protein EDB91DRAFT_810434 [Suillus paluster]KAG1729498.1 hypothetical protein EDB91DRAFT_810434 [Suillus paluster]
MNVPENGDALVVRPNVNAYHPAICASVIASQIQHLSPRHRPQLCVSLLSRTCFRLWSRLSSSMPPGPCLPCAVTVHKGCWCGCQVSNILCSLASPNSTSGVSCGLTCRKPLSCGNPRHTHAQVFHLGDRKLCGVAEVVSCYCRKGEMEVSCADRKN